MTIHPLRLAFVDYIKEHYGFHLWGDKTPERTEVVAQKVSRLGLGYDEFVDVAVSLWEEWSENKGWPYPYWTLVTSDKTFERLDRLLGLTESALSDSGDIDQFELELMFAVTYIRWMLGHVDCRPKRPMDVAVNVRTCVAQYICTAYGVEFVIPNYNYIASQMRGKLGR